MSSDASKSFPIHLSSAAALVTLGALLATATCSDAGTSDGETGGAAGALASPASSGAGGSAGGAGGASAEGAGGSGGAGGTGDPPAEDCANGVDDDGDGKMDCADPACNASHRCVSEGPLGFSSPRLLFVGAPADDPGCPAAFPSSVYTGAAGLVAPEAACSTCSCDDPSGQTCQLELFVSDASCAEIQAGPFCRLSLDMAMDGTCFENGRAPGGLTSCGNPGSFCAGGHDPCNASVSVSLPTVAGGSCKESDQTPDVPQATWGTFARACAAPAEGGGCNSGTTCLPRPTSPWLPGLCISKPGDIGCPANYPDKHVFYDAVPLDDRDCTPCDCSDPEGGGCAPFVEVYKDAAQASCGSLLATLDPGTCKDLPANPTVGSRKVKNGGVTGGSCTPSGGEPIGEATPKGPVTFCCQGAPSEP